MRFCPIFTTGVAFPSDSAGYRMENGHDLNVHHPAIRVLCLLSDRSLLFLIGGVSHLQGSSSGWVWDTLHGRSSGGSASGASECPGVWLPVHVCVTLTSLRCAAVLSLDHSTLLPSRRLYTLWAVRGR